MRSVTCLASVVVLVMGCDGEQPLSKARLARLEVLPLNRLLTLELQPEPPCTFHPAVTATQNGVPLRQVSAGERSQATFVDIKLPSGAARCAGPVWETLAIDNATPVTFVVEDSSARITAELVAFGGGFRLVTPAITHPGETVTVEWSPSAKLTKVQSTRISIDRGGGADIFGATTEGSRLSFVVPEASRFAFLGPGELVLVADADREFVRCDGVPACSSPFVALSEAPRLRLTVEP